MVGSCSLGPPTITVCAPLSSTVAPVVCHNCSALAKIIIPFGVTSIGNNAFGGCSLLTLYTILSEKPAGWASNWNGGCTIEWETGSDTPSVYHFVANGGTEIEDIVSNKIIELPVPEKFGYTFVGWFDNPELEGTVYSGKYYSPNDVTFYAKWDEYQIQSEGLSIKNGMIVGIGSCTDTELVLDMPVAEGAFIGCHTITKVTFGPGVTSIGDQAFGNSGTGCDKLTEVVFLSPVPPEIGRDVFGSTWNHVAGFTVYVPTGSLAAYEAVDDTYWQEYLVYEGKIKEM